MAVVMMIYDEQAQGVLDSLGTVAGSGLTLPPCPTPPLWCVWPVGRESPGISWRLRSDKTIRAAAAIHLTSHNYVDGRFGFLVRAGRFGEGERERYGDPEAGQKSVGKIMGTDDREVAQR